jgi:hypothetical protein
MNPIRDVQDKNRPQLNVNTPTSRIAQAKKKPTLDDMRIPEGGLPGLPGVPDTYPGKEGVEMPALEAGVPPLQEAAPQQPVVPTEEVEVEQLPPVEEGSVAVPPSAGDVSLEALRDQVVTPYRRDIDPNDNEVTLPGGGSGLDATPSDAFKNAPTIGEANTEAATNLRGRQDNVNNIATEDGEIVTEWEEYGLYDGKPATVGENENRSFYDRIYKTVEGFDDLLNAQPTFQSTGPLPQTRTDGRQFRPDSTANAFRAPEGSWRPFGGVFDPNSANGRGLSFSEFGTLLRGFGLGALDRRTTNQFSYGQYGTGSMGRLFYGLSLPGNLLKGALTDVEQATQRARTTGKSQRIGYSNLRRAFQGDNYDFAQPQSASRPLSVMKPLRFFGGLAADIITDPLDVLVGGLSEAGKVRKALPKPKVELPSTRALPPSSPVAGVLPPLKSAGTLDNYYYRPGRATKVTTRDVLPKLPPRVIKLEGVPTPKVLLPTAVDDLGEAVLIKAPGPKYLPRTTVFTPSASRLPTPAELRRKATTLERNKAKFAKARPKPTVVVVDEAQKQAQKFLKDVRERAVQHAKEAYPTQPLLPTKVTKAPLLSPSKVDDLGEAFLVVDTDAVFTSAAQTPTPGKRVLALPVAKLQDVQQLVTQKRLVPTEGGSLVLVSQKVAADVAQVKRIDAVVERLSLSESKVPTKVVEALGLQRQQLVQNIKALLTTSTSDDVLDATAELVEDASGGSPFGGAPLPVVKQEDLVGTPSTTEVMEQLDEFVPGSQVNPNVVTEVRRTNKDLTQLAVELGHIKPRKKALSRVQLDALEAKHGDLYRAEGRPVRDTIEKLRSTKSPLVELVAKSSDGTPAELVPVSIPRPVQEVQEGASVVTKVEAPQVAPGAVEVAAAGTTEDILRKRTELEGLLDDAKSTEEFDQIVQQIDELDEMLVGPPNIHDSRAIARYQSESLPRGLRAETPQGLAKTRELMAAEQLVDEASFAEQRLLSELEDQQLLLERALNDIEQFPDTGRLPLPNNPNVPTPRVGDRALNVAGNVNPGLVEDLLETPLFHGTKVQGLDFKTADPLRGGSRGEFGPVHYFTNQPDVAENFAKARPNSNLPPVEGRNIAEQGEVLEVGLSTKSPLDATLPGDEDIRRVFVEEAKKTNIAEDIVERYARELEQGHTPKAKKPPRPLREYWNLLGETRQEEMGRLLNDMNVDFPEKAILEFQRRVNARLVELGYDSIVMYDNAGQMVVGVLDPMTIATVNRTMVEATDLLDMATARVNATSHIAELNPQAVTSKVDLKEALIALQTRMVENTQTLLDEAAALAGRYADHAHRTRKKLEKLAKEEQTQKRVTETTQAILEDADQSRKLNEPPTPCEF